MKTFLKPFEEMPQIEELREHLKKDKRIYEVSGLIDSLKPHLIYGIGYDVPIKLIVTFDEMRAKQIYEGYQFFDENTLYYPARDLLFYQSDIHSNALTRERLSVVQALIEHRPVTVVTTMDALMNRVPPLSSYERGIFTIDLEETVDLDEMRKKLVMLGYENVTQVEHPGEFAVRGGIVDIFPLTEEHPIRMELWGDEIDSLRYFDVATQKSIDSVEHVTVYPAMELVLTPEEIETGLKRMEADAEELYQKYRSQMRTEEAHRIKTGVEQLATETREWGLGLGLETHLNYFVSQTESLLSYFPPETLVFLDELVHLDEKGKVIEQEFSDSMTSRLEKGYCLPGQLEMLLTTKSVFAMLQKHPGVVLSTLDSREGLLSIAGHTGVRAVSVGAYNNQFELLVKDLKRFKDRKYRILLLSPSRTRGNHLAENLMDQDLNAFFSEDYDHEIYPGEIMVSVGNLARGYEFPESSFVILSEQDIFGSRARRKKKKTRKYEGEQIAGLSDLTIGDYVVHENHGLGIYQGFEKIEVDKVVKDYIKISYAKGGNLYIPATQLDAIQKYGSQDGKKPKLNTLGTQDWVNTKNRVRAAVGVVAKELVDLYALREQNQGYVYGPDTVWQQEFEETFPYEETDGQLEAIAAVKQDMMSSKIMDRLICGDVGYGKTEIALRAAFKALQDGKQVVYLVPTTILAQQHYNTFVQRMKDFPVRVDLLSRFRTPSQVKKTLEDLKKGLVDVVIGTHRVLSKDVHFKDLGLLIIDEEQRFGVSDKEKIKKLRENVDVLTLTATPIPRTLHMSLVGIRDMSVLEEPPVDRVPIQTYVMEYNDEMVREGIKRELARGGQVYYVYNRVKDIEEVANHVAQLVPDANVVFAHGQMHEHQLEKIMLDFINGDIDVLVSTTIIETGLDISNANTMIIQDADHMGLSQLYQLRGRVGRSSRTSYAFLMYKRDKVLKEVAEKRLQAIREFTELGSGIKIAMRDLEIRGAGNVLGAEQHGHMEAVGYDLYCKLLNQAVEALRGKRDEEEDFQTVVDCDIDAYIPVSYIKNEYQKLDVYKRISAIESEEEYMDMQDELIDRFGDIPKAVDNLLRIALIKALAHQAYVTEVGINRQEVRISMFPKAKLNTEGIPALVAEYKGALKMQMGETPGFLYQERNKKNQDCLSMADKAQEILKRLQELCVKK